MAKTVLWFNGFVFMWFGYEMAQYYSANRALSDFATAFIVHDSFLAVVIAIMNSIVIIGLVFEIKERVKDNESKRNMQKS